MIRIVKYMQTCFIVSIIFCCTNVFSMKLFEIENNFEVKKPFFVGPVTVVRKGHVGNNPGSSILLANKLLAMGVDKEIKFFDLENGEEKASFNHGDWISQKETSLLKLPKGNLIASFDKSVVKIWDINGGFCKSEIEVNKGYPEFVIGILGINKNRIASYSHASSSTIKIWNIGDERGKLVGAFKGHKDIICDLLKITDKYLASASHDGTVRVWDIELGKCIYNLTGHNGKVLKVVKISDDMIASGDSEGVVKVWNLKDGSCIRTFFEKKEEVKKLKVSSNKIIVCHKRGDIRIWDLKTGELLKTLIGHTNNVKDLIVVNSKILISCSKDGTIKIWDLNKEIWIQSIFCGYIVNKIFITSLQSVFKLIAVTWDSAIIACPCAFTCNSDSKKYN